MTDPLEAVDVPGVRYLKAYTAEDPPPLLKTWWVKHDGLDLRVGYPRPVGRVHR